MESRALRICRKVVRSKVMTKGTVSPDLMTQWKQCLDQWIAAWSKILEQAMGTESFAQAMGKQLEGFLSVAAPVKKAAEQQVEALAACSEHGCQGRGSAVGGDLINIGDNQPDAVGAEAKGLAKSLGRPPGCVFAPPIIVRDGRRDDAPDRICFLVASYCSFGLPTTRFWGSRVSQQSSQVGASTTLSYRKWSAE